MNRLKVADSPPEVGIWWYVDGKVLKYSQPWTEVVDDGGDLCVEKEHIYHWRVVQQEHPELKDFKYDSFPRGRVWYRKDTRTCSITCSKEFMQNSVGLQAVKDSFDLNGRKLKVVEDQQYVR